MAGREFNVDLGGLYDECFAALGLALIPLIMRLGDDPAVSQTEMLSVPITLLLDHAAILAHGAKIDRTEFVTAIATIAGHVFDGAHRRQTGRS